MLEILDMSEKGRLSNFMKGLQTWAQMELRKQNVQTPADAIATADKLLD
jgi:flagellin-specific chaperone FliS